MVDRMSETPPPTPLTDRAMQRLRKIAEGNGLKESDIHLFYSEEKTYAIEGTILLSPLFETTGGRYVGAPPSDRRVLASPSAMKAEISRMQSEFNAKPTWINECLAQIKEQAGGGWGLDDRLVPLPSRSVILAASENCPTCQGGKVMTCPQCGGARATICVQCQGNRQELCHVCAGRGTNPAQPDQPCIHCQGRRYLPCRFCNGLGQLPCPTCHGQGGTVCQNCKGSGLISEEINITCGARTQFRLKAEGLPSGLRRGLDRLGIANLVKGHADIESLAPPPEAEDETPPTMTAAPQEAKQPKPPKPELHYLAHLPYADLRMSFLGKKVIVSVFGKKSVMLGVPPFLDVALEKTRDLLQQAARGTIHLETALDKRLMRDALRLQLAGKGNANALRQIYPLGLSLNVAEEIMRGMRLALNRLTLRARGAVAALGVLVGGGFFAALFFTVLHQQITQSWTVAEGAAFDGGVLVATMAGCWFALSFITRFALQKRFPDYTIPLTQKTGKTGYAMLAGIVVAFVAVALMAPVKAEWLSVFMR